MHGPSQNTFSPAEVAAKVTNPQWPDYAYIRSVISRGHLHRIPAEALAKVDFIVPDKVTRVTCLHVAAKAGRLDQLPDGVVTAEAMTTPSQNGDTPMHLAARSGSLYQLPKELLTTETLLVGNRAGVTALDVADELGFRDQLPPETDQLKAFPIPTAGWRHPLRPSDMELDYGRPELFGAKTHKRPPLPTPAVVPEMQR